MELLHFKSTKFKYVTRAAFCYYSTNGEQFAQIQNLVHILVNII
jgi:hypothetical protein